MGAVGRDADGPDAVHVGVVRLVARVGNAGDGGVVRRGLGGRGVPAGPANAHGAGAVVDGGDQVILLLGLAGGDQLEIVVHGGLELVGVDGRLVVVVDDPAAEAQQDGQEVHDSVVVGVAAVDEALLAGGLRGLADGQDVVQIGDAVAGEAGGLDVGLVVEQDRDVAVVGSQIGLAVHDADLGGGRDDVVVQGVAQGAQVGQNAVRGELGHPGAVHHAQVIGARGVDGVQRDAGVQVVLAQLEDLAGDVVVRLELRQALLDNVGIGAGAQDQRHLGGLGGALVVPGAGVGVRVAVGIGVRVRGPAAAGGETQNQNERKDQCDQLFHVLSSIIIFIVTL